MQLRPLEMLAALMLAVLSFGLGHVTARASAETPPRSPERLEEPDRPRTPQRPSRASQDATEPEVVRFAELERQQAEARWYAGVAQAELERRWYAAAAEADAARAARAAGGEGTHADASASAPSGREPGFVNGYPCGGDLPPCSVLRRESGGNPTARNPSSSACGLWQFISSTWDGFGGYASACDAPAEVQNEKARLLWAGGAGCGHWAPTDGCG